MTLDKAQELFKTQTDFGGFYNRHGAKLILAEASSEHGQAAVDSFIAELKLEGIFQFQPGKIFNAPS